MITSRVAPVDEPRPFEAHELFFSLTDDKGRIRYGNQVFTRVSAYPENELLGRAHNIVRHPDMPRCVFRLFWDYLEAGKTIAAYVKNLAADGRYYWVLAVATPCRDGYLSVRLKPSSPLFEAARALYADTLRFEAAREIEHGKQTAMTASAQRLLASLAEHGYADYDQFMHAALRAELELRKSGAAESPSELPPRTPLGSLGAALGRVQSELQGVFASLDVFDSLSTQLQAKQEAMCDLGPSLTFLSLNTHISATRLGDEGAVLSVVSRNLGERSKDADRLIEALMQRMRPACEAARAIAFEIATALLEAEVCQSFVNELLLGDSTQNNQLVAESLSTLIDELSDRCRKVVAALQALRDDVGAMTQAAKSLVGQVEQMRTAQLNGKIEIASHRNAGAFASIFEDVARIVGEARRNCDDVIGLLSATGDRLTSLLQVEGTLRNDLAEVEAAKQLSMAQIGEASLAV